MTDAELLTAVKAGLTVSGTYNDNALMPKVLAAKQYMLNAGTTIAQLESSLGIEILTLGVNDLWNLSSGEVKFSKVFHMLLAQLSISSSVLTLLSSNPADGAEGVEVNICPTLTFNNMLSAYDVAIVDAISQIEVPTTKSLDITKKILTIKPDSNLEADTRYAIVINNIKDDSGHTLKYTVIQFTTA